jgi:hypothetical protein
MKPSFIPAGYKFAAPEATEEEKARGITPAPRLLRNKTAEGTGPAEIYNRGSADGTPQAVTGPDGAKGVFDEQWQFQPFGAPEGKQWKDGRLVDSAKPADQAAAKPQAEG